MLHVTVLSPGDPAITLAIKASSWVKDENRSRLAAEPSYLPGMEDYGVVFTYSDRDMFACACSVYLMYYHFQTVLSPIWRAWAC